MRVIFSQRELRFIQEEYEFYGQNKVYSLSHHTGKFNVTHGEQLKDAASPCDS